MTIIILSILALMFTIQSHGIYATSNDDDDAYDSGPDHGCDDAKISDPDDRYINQPEKGPSFHTGAFMDGYHAGYNSCGGGSERNSNDDSNSNSNSNQNRQAMCVIGPC